jgi:hypothetical protein
VSIPIKIVIPVLVITIALATFASSRAALIEGDGNNTQCQYPTRPLVDGHCDNMEPALAEPQPVAQTPPTPTTSPSPTPKKPSCIE